MSERLKNVLAGLAGPVRIYLGVVFITAAWYKIADPAAFGLSIATYGILPDSLVNPLAVTLPWVEVVTGATLILGFWTRASALCICGMMIMFLVALGVALHQGLQMSCGCFASAEAGDEISNMTLVRDGLWLAGALWVLSVDDGRFGLDGLLRRRRKSGT
jgi:uncharacterized membrane protein YphA (DoxX/SURF4 family)